MNPLVFWNELSERPLAATAADGNARMDRLIDSLAALRRAVPNAPMPLLRSHAALHGVALADGHTVANWQTRADQARRSLFLRLATSAPLLRADDGKDPMERYCCADCWVGSASGLGFRAAWAADELAVSLDSDSRWANDAIAAEIEVLEEDGASFRDAVVIRHLSQPSHVAAHVEWLVARVRSSVLDARDLWRRRGVLLPNLEFCNEVEAQLESLDAGSDQFRHVLSRLFALDAKIAACLAAKQRETIGRNFLPFKCVPETPQTLIEEAADHTATRPSGATHLFSWHVRFPPDGGRLFFDVDQNTGLGLVGYIGVKKGGRLS